MGRPGRRGFTLVEVLVTTVLVAVALVGVMGGVRALTAADIKARDADLLQRLATQKLNELGVVEDPRTADDSGDFTDEGHPGVAWTIDVQPSGAEYLDQVTVTASRGDDSQSLTGLVYVRPLTGSGGE